MHRDARVCLLWLSTLIPILTLLHTSHLPASVAGHRWEVCNCTHRGTPYPGLVHFLKSAPAESEWVWELDTRRNSNNNITLLRSSEVRPKIPLLLRRLSAGTCSHLHLLLVSLSRIVGVGVGVVKMGGDVDVDKRERSPTRVVSCVVCNVLNSSSSP